MKTFCFFLKGVLLWSTLLSLFCFIAGGFESMVAEHLPYAVLWTLINIILVFCCYFGLTYKDVYKLSGTDWIEKLCKR